MNQTKDSFFFKTDKDVKAVFMKIVEDQFPMFTAAEVLTYLMIHLAKVDPAERIRTVLDGQQEFLKIHYGRKGIMPPVDMADYLKLRRNIDPFSEEVEQE